MRSPKHTNNGVYSNIIIHQGEGSVEMLVGISTQLQVYTKRWLKRVWDHGRGFIAAKENSIRF